MCRPLGSEQNKEICMFFADEKAGRGATAQRPLAEWCGAIFVRLYPSRHATTNANSQGAVWLCDGVARQNAPYATSAVLLRLC
jgi:hypothetical protein